MASKAQNEEIIDPNGLDLFRLTMMVITASICGGIFSLAGDMAAGGANTGAVIVSWGICFIGVFALMMVFNGLSQARPDRRHLCIRCGRFWRLHWIQLRLGLLDQRMSFQRELCALAV